MKWCCTEQRIIVTGRSEDEIQTPGQLPIFITLKFVCKYVSVCVWMQVQVLVKAFSIQALDSLDLSGITDGCESRDAGAGNRILSFRKNSMVS